VAPLDHTNPSFTSCAPRLGSLEPTLFFPAASLLTAGVPIGNGNIFHSQGFGLFFIRPRVKPSVGCNPSWNSTQFALVGCDRWQQQALIAGPLFEHFIVSNNLVLRFLEFDHVAKLVRLRRLPLAYDFRVGFKQAQQFVLKLRNSSENPGLGLPHYSAALDPPSFPGVPLAPAHPVSGGPAAPRLPAAPCGNR